MFLEIMNLEPFIAVFLKWERETKTREEAVIMATFAFCLQP